MERCVSGLNSTLGKGVYFNEYRGFESHLLRHLFEFETNYEFYKV